MNQIEIQRGPGTNLGAAPMSLAPTWAWHQTSGDFSMSPFLLWHSFLGGIKVDMC